MHDKITTPHLQPSKASEFKNVTEFLAAHGIKPTRQRVAIATHMYACQQHLSADAILEQVNRDSATTNVSKATVYNTLKLFVREGILREVAIDPQRILFDTNTHHHHHLMNIETGEIRDIAPLTIDASNITCLADDDAIDSIDLVIRVTKKPQPDPQLR